MSDELTSQTLLKITKKFLCCVPIENIELQDLLDNSTWEQQQILLNKTVKTVLVQRYPIKLSYQKAFLKKVIEILEQNSIEVHDELYDTFCNILNVDDNEKYCYKHYLVEDIVVTLKENTSFISEGTTGLCSWQASLALSQWCLNNKTTLHNTTILELGSGIGLLGLTVAQLCQPTEIHLSDCHQKVLEVLCENVRLNQLKSGSDSFVSGNSADKTFGSGIGSSGTDSSGTDNSGSESSSNFLLTSDITTVNSTVKVSVFDLNWETVQINKCCDLLVPDLILAADVVYDYTVFEPLCETVKYFLDRNINIKVIFACTERNSDTLQQFLELLESKNLKITNLETPKPTDLFWSQAVPIKLFLVTAK